MSLAPRNGCYWTEEVAALPLPPVRLAPRYEVVIVGGGYSGLATALNLARRGMHVAVLEKHRIGHGCSSRNGGMAGPSFHPLGMAGLQRRYGAAMAMRLQGEALAAREFFAHALTEEGLDADFRVTGRFRGARNAKDFAAMREECDRLHQAVGLNHQVVGAGACRDFIGSDSYAGGVVYPDDAAIHPAKLVQALAKRAFAAGVTLCEQSPVTGLTRDGAGWVLRTATTTLLAHTVVLATNGYSSRAVPSLYQRVVPISVAVTATRDLGAARIAAMSPRHMLHGETGRVFVWSRPSPDGTRFIFGGRFAREAAAPRRKARLFARQLQRIYPELTPADFEMFWHGWVGYSADHAPHLNQIDGLWHIGGYCGSGVTRSLYFADKLARKITGAPGSDTAFDQLTFPKIRFRPLAGIGAAALTEWNKWRDRRD